jgi:hypothetical protein
MTLGCMSSMTRIARGAYVPSDRAEQLTDRCRALLVALPATAVLSGWTAAALHGMWLPPESSGWPIDVTVPATDRAPRSLPRPRSNAVMPHRRALAWSEITLQAGLPVTTIGRSWRDRASVLSLADLVAAGDSALRRSSVDDLAGAIEQQRRRRGTRRALDALSLLDVRSDSRPESHLRVIVHGWDAVLRTERARAR